MAPWLFRVAAWNVPCSLERESLEPCSRVSCVCSCKWGKCPISVLHPEEMSTRGSSISVGDKLDLDNCRDFTTSVSTHLMKWGTREQYFAKALIGGRRNRNRPISRWYQCPETPVGATFRLSIWLIDSSSWGMFVGWDAETVASFSFFTSLINLINKK